MNFKCFRNLIMLFPMFLTSLKLSLKDNSRRFYHYTRLIKIKQRTFNVKQTNYKLFKKSIFD
jgi:hypothetical protein